MKVPALSAPPLREWMRGAALVLVSFVLPDVTRAQVVLSEIHYHPVEKSTFKPDGTPVLDLSKDLHEFIKLQNAGPAEVDLGGWKLTSGVKFTFPAGTKIPAGGFVVVAADPVRLAVVYPSLNGVLGPYTGVLKNSGETQNLLNAGGTVVDSVTYGTTFPWPNTPDALGADEEWTLIPTSAYQFKGRSLQRVSAFSAGNDPANWLASPPLSGGTGGPNPGGPNAVVRPTPRPVVLALSARQESDGAVLIRANQPTRITCTFSAGPVPASPVVEYFIDDINSFTEPRLTVPLTLQSTGLHTAILPGQLDRKIIRYRIKGDRGDGAEPISPRTDDAPLVPVTATTREAWHAYFISPVRAGATPPNVNRPIYDCFVSSTNLTRMNTNISQNPKRVTTSDARGLPREVPWVLPTAPIWNGTVPAVFISNGVVYDTQLRYHGSRYNRSAGRNSFKLLFAGFQPFDGDTSTFITDKQDLFITGQGLFENANLPLSRVRWVDWYLNGNAKLSRAEQGEYDGDLLDAYHQKMKNITGSSTLEETGEFYKSAGTLELPEGPYGKGNESLLAAVPASGTFAGWQPWQRYDYTYSLQNHSWKGATPLKAMLDGLWAARGTTAEVIPAANIPAVRAWFEANFDVQTTLTSMALLNWMCPWDDTTQNHFVWRRANGKWSHVPWDFDGMYGAGDGTSATSSIFLGEVNNPNNNSRGPNYLKDAFFKAFREEFKQRIWFVTNTLCDPNNLSTLTYTNASGVQRTYLQQIGGFAASRQTYINGTSSTGLGTFYKPVRPVNQLPAVAGNLIPNVLPGASLTGSVYVHSKTAAPVAHASSRWEIRLANGTYDAPAAFHEGAAYLTAWPIPFSQLTYGSTYYWRVKYLDADGHPSILSAETAFTYGPPSAAAGPLVFNEVLADNRRTLAHGDSFPDYIELKNNTGTALDLTGISLTDDPLLPNRFVFPPGTTIPAQGYLVVWGDGDTAAPGLHTGFALGAGGENLLLLNGASVLDALSFGPQAPDLSISRVGDGTGAWQLTVPSPNLTNTSALPSGAKATLSLNEWMAEPQSGEDWFELYNPDANPVALAGCYLSDTPSQPTLTRLPALSFIAGKGYFRFQADGSPLGFGSVNFKLSGGGSPLLLTDTDGVTPLATVNFGTQALGVSGGRLPDGSAVIRAFPGTASPGTSNFIPAPVVINEALTHSTPPLEDAVELYNPGPNDVDLGGWWLSDDADQLKKYQFPMGSMILAGGYKVIYENEFNPLPALPAGFALKSFGDQLLLSEVGSAGMPTGRRSVVRFGAAEENGSFGRVPTSTGADFAALTAPTFGADDAITVTDFRVGRGALNAPVKIGPVVIHEIMYRPADIAGPAGFEDNSEDEFVELLNRSGGALDVSGWRLREAMDFTFPAGTTLAAGAYALIVGFDPVVDTASRAAFLTNYALPPGTVLHGPYLPVLDNAGASLELARPNDPLTAPGVLVDQVQYRDIAPWPTGADGTGLSLQRVNAEAYGNDPVNWAARPPTPGAINPDAMDTDSDGMTDPWETVYLMNPSFAGDATQDADGDGLTNAAEFAAGTDPRDRSSALTATLKITAGTLKLQFTAQPGKVYAVEASSQLHPGSWQQVARLPAAAASSLVERDLGPVTTGRIFYRVVTPPRP